MRPTPEPTRVLIGTSGYSYKDWIGPFYPRGLAPGKMLSYYAEEFSFTEINYTYYRMPNAKSMAAMAAKVPESFTFSVKAYQGITHQRGKEAGMHCNYFNDALEPLINHGKLGAVLLQFPFSFHNREENRHYLALLREWLPELPLVVEFRHRSWEQRAVWDFLSTLNIGYTCVDEPRLRGLMGNSAVCTAPVSYLRFHGRNAAQWWEHNEAYERYNYEYSREELVEWLPAIVHLREKASVVYVAFNNHYQGRAVLSARLLKDVIN